MRQKNHQKNHQKNDPKKSRQAQEKENAKTMDVEWIFAKDPVPYEEALATMEARVQAIYEGRAREAVWLLEHPPLYTAGTSAKASDLLNPRFPVYDAGRGGQYTYHGPGQRVAYVMVDLRKRGQDVRAYVWKLEEWLIRSLLDLGVQAFRREGRVGLWVPRTAGWADDKIAAIGVRIRHWITFHGVSLNVQPDLSHFSGIIPCGIREHGVTSLANLNVPTTMEQVDQALIKHWDSVFQSINTVQTATNAVQTTHANQP